MNKKLKLATYRIGNTTPNFLEERNRIMIKTRADLVMILNDDIEVTNYKQSLSLFEEDPKLFAVTFSPESSGNNKVTDAYFANGGSSIYKRKIWQEIGGIDPMFYPAWWDDVDYSLTAREKGYKIYEDGRVLVKKVKGEMGVETLKKDPKMLIIEKRNYLLCLMKHDRDEYEKIKNNITVLPFRFLAEMRFKKFYPNK